MAIGIGLLYSSNPDTRSYASQFLKSKLPDLLRSYTDADTAVGPAEGGLHDVATEILHLIISHLLHDRNKNSPALLGVSEELKDSFLRTLRKDFPRDRVPAVVAPLLYPESSGDLAMDRLLYPTSVSASVPKSALDNSLASIIHDSGFVFCATLEECKANLTQVGLNELTNAGVATTLAMMAKTCDDSGAQNDVGLHSFSTPAGSATAADKDKPSAASSDAPTTWNVEIFVQAVTELQPKLSWKLIVEELDHPGFLVVSKNSLKLLVKGLKLGLGSEPFPIEPFYRIWKNTEGQLSWLSHSIKAPDVFCFADYPCHTVVTDNLKAPPEEDNRDIAVWKSLDLIEALLRLSEAGHYTAVVEIFQWPVNHCPDMLLLGLLQISTYWNTLKAELSAALFPLFLGQHANAAVVLHYAWHCQGNGTTIRQLIMRAMAEWYMKGENTTPGGAAVHDPSRLSRILDVAQDLKALSMLLNGTPYAFVIDLACLASRREYLKLDKWLSDKIREHGEPFIAALIQFLKRRCPQLFVTSGKPEDAHLFYAGAAGAQSKAHQLPPDTLSTIALCLQTCVGSVSRTSYDGVPDLNEALVTVIGNAGSLLNNKQMYQPNRVPPTNQPQPPKPPALEAPMSANAPAGVQSIVQSQLANIGAGTDLTSLMKNLTMARAGGPNPDQVPSLLGNTSWTPGMSQIQLPASLAGTTPTQSNSGGAAAAAMNLSGLASLPAGFPNGQNGLGAVAQAQLDAAAAIGSQKFPGMKPPNPMDPRMSQMGNAQTVMTPSSLTPQQQQQQPQQQPQQPQPQQPAKANSSFASAVTQDNISSLFPEMSQNFSKEIDDEANSYFQRIYNHPPHPTLSIEEVLEMLKQFKDSTVKKEKDVFSCMLRNLFEEYRFFPQYPERELSITACLFGGIIAEGLVTYVSLGIALRYVLEALRKPATSKMYIFGVRALDRFKHRLADYPQYCQHLAAIQHFNKFPSPLIEYIEYGARSQEPPVSSAVAAAAPIPEAPVMPAAVPVTPAPTPTTSAPAKSTPTTAVAGKQPSIANATNIDTLLVATESDEKMVPLPEEKQDKVAFIFNNLSQANMPQKSEELKKLMSDEYWRWVSQYLVMKRVSIEPNFHTLYANFLDALDKKEFITMILKETFRNIRVLLRSDKSAANFSDRTLLKNLGHFLGMLTLMKNKPILHIDIDIKSLILEAFIKGQQEMLYVIPFVAKVMESCAKSRIFRPPNPWTMGIMNLLAELHADADLKLNLKFEIEVLCKTLGLDLSECKPGNLLKDMERLSNIIPQLSSPKAVPHTGQMISATSTPQQPAEPGTTPISTPTSNALATTPQLQQVPLTPQPQYSYFDIATMSPAGLSPHININANAPLFITYPQLKQCVKPAVERAIQELLGPVVERSIKIALSTCEQIVKKDFACDPEEQRLRMASHHMMRFMTAGMALITCKEPLIISIANNFKTACLNMIRTPTNQQKEGIDLAAQTVANDNVELGCVFIQKTAVEKALPEIDKRLMQELEVRKQAKVDGKRYFDGAVLRFHSERMPEPIALKAGGITSQQITVYDEFARNIPGFIPPSENELLMLQNQTQQSAASIGASIAGGPPLPPFSDIRSLLRKNQDNQPFNNIQGEDILTLYDKCIQEVEGTIQQFHSILSTLANPAPPGCELLANQYQSLTSLREAILLARTNPREIVPAISLLQKAVEGILECVQVPNPTPMDEELAQRYMNSHMVVLKTLQSHRAFGPEWTNKQVTRHMIQDIREELRYNAKGVKFLIKGQLVSMPQYDQTLSQWMENGNNYVAMVFSMQLVKKLLVDEFTPVVKESELYTTLETMARIATHARPPPEGLPQLLEAVRNASQTSISLSASVPHGIVQPPLAPGDGLDLTRHQQAQGIQSGGPTSMMHSGIAQASEFDDPPGLHEKTEYLLREWVNMFHSPVAGKDSNTAFSTFVTQMHQHGILKTDDLITRFFRLCTEMCVDLCYRALSEQNNYTPTIVRAKCFHTLDAFVRLIALLVKHSGDSNNTVTKINLLNKVLGIVTGVLLQDHDVRATDFQQLPYHRIFIMLFMELNSPETILEAINFSVLTAFCNTLHILRPSKAPAFAYAWLELVSHRAFIGRLLMITPQQKGWGMYAHLIIDLFKFLAPFLRNAELTKPMQLLYKGTLRVLLVLLHDFPEFLCDYHYAFCDVIPCNCIQMRNLILSAFPRNMRLPDPFTPNLKVDVLPEIACAPRILTSFTQVLQERAFKKDLDSYLRTRAPVTFLSDLRGNLQLSNEPGFRYNISLLNALVLYVGTQAIQDIRHNRSLAPSIATIAHSSHMDIFQNLAVDLDTEGRYLFLNAIANQLRYPNSHTHYFSCTLLYLFAEANLEATQEQITRVLLERLIVNRPHPWGLLITFIELIKNPQFKFWSHDFVRCAPEIENLFESVAKSCGLAAAGKSPSNFAPSPGQPALPAPPPPPETPSLANMPNMNK